MLTLTIGNVWFSSLCMNCYKFVDSKMNSNSYMSLILETKKEKKKGENIN